MRKGEYKLIPFLGINTEVLNDQSPDGLCEEIINLKPKGTENQPYWVPFERILSLTNSNGEDFSYQHGIENITGAFWQLRNFIGDFALSQDQSLKRLIVLCNKSDRKAIDIIDPSDWTIVATQLLEDDGEYELSCTRVGQITVVDIIRNGLPYKLYYLQDDIFVPQGWPDIPDVSFSTINKTFTEEELQAGTVEGIQRGDNEQFFMARWAFRLYDGTYVKHSTPVLQVVDTGPETRFMLPRFILDGYENPIDFKEFWEGYIAGVSVFCSFPKDTQKEALDDGVFYEVGFWSFIDKQEPEEWTTEEDPNIIVVKLRDDAWPTQRVMNIDNFTHHKFAGKVVDTYNSRLLLGGVGIDFALPKTKAHGGDNVPIEEISEIMTEVSANGIYDSRVYDENWQLTDPQIWSSNNEIINENCSINYTPVEGKEFKSVQIIESATIVEGEADIPVSGKPDPNPEVSHSATISDPQSLTISMDYELAMGVDCTGYIDGGGYYYLVLQLTIGEVGNESNNVTYQFNVTMMSESGGSGLTSDTYFDFDDIHIPNTGNEQDLEYFHVITIKTDNGTYYRISKQEETTSINVISIPKLISYPDRRATNYTLIIKNGSNYETALNKKLIQHPANNYSYIRLEDGENTYTLGSSSVTSQEGPDLSLNLILNYVRNMVQASETNQPLTFDAAATYRVGNKENDTIQAFAVNAVDISSGQYGQYPLYVLTDKSAWALEQTSDPSIAFGSITPVNNFNGTDNPYAVCNTSDQSIVAADRNYIYILQGQNAQRIDRPISQDPEYDDYLTGIRLAFHKAQDYEELICSNPDYDYSWIYNIRYGVWYKGTETFRYFFQDQPNILGITNDNTVKNFQSKDTAVPISWSIKTRPWNLGNPFSRKKWIKGNIRMAMKQPYHEDVEKYHHTDVVLKGWLETRQGYDIVKFTTVDHENIKKDLFLITRFGVFDAFSLEIKGTHQQEGSYLQLVEVNSEVRYNHRVRL